MEIRDAVEADAERMADIAESPPDVMRNLVHDRTVRVACESSEDDGSADPAAGSDANGEPAPERDADAIVGLVSFDARDSTVHVTQLAGETEACRRLLEEPIGFAEREGMSVELLVPEHDDAVEDAVEASGFAPTGTGPQFAGERTTRYRLEPGTPEQ